VLWDTCAEALAAGPVSPGKHLGIATSWTDDGAASCIANGAGHDGYAMVTVAPGELLDLAASLGGANASVALLESCDPNAACVTSADRFSSQPEEVEWYNDTRAPVDLVVKVDSRAAAAPSSYVLNVTQTAYAPAVLADTCPEAKLLSPIEPGTWSTTSESFTSVVANTCFFQRTPGVDAFAPVRIPPWTLWTASYDKWGGTDNPMLMLINTCGAWGECVEAADGYFGDARVVYVNASPEPVDAMLVLDTDKLDTTPSRLFLAVTSETIASFPTYETCGEALSGVHIAPGSYAGDLSTARPDQNVGACVSGAGTPGEDLFAAVDVPPGASLTVELDELAGDGAVYLLSDCGGLGTCLDGSDSGGIEQVLYTNTFGGTVSVVVGVDTWTRGGLGAFHVHVGVQ